MLLEDLQLKISSNLDSGLKGLDKVENSLKSLNNTTKSFNDAIGSKMFKSVVGANIVTGILSKTLQAVEASFRFLNKQIGDSITTTQNYEAALTGLATVTARKLGSEAVPQATEAVRKLAEDGLLPVQDAATGLKNLLASGFNLDQATNLMNVFKDSASFGRQSALSFGQAVSSATEGIKNGNSILVDNAGITKNLSLILQEAGYSAQDLMKVQSDLNVRTALYNGLVKEGLLFQGDAAKLANTTAGQMARISTLLVLIKTRVGQFIKPIQQVLQSALLSFLSGVESTLISSQAFLQNYANRIAGAILGALRVIGSLLSRIPVIGAAFNGLANLTVKPLKTAKNLTDSQNAYSGATDKASKSTAKLKKELAGLASFDEMNVLNTPDKGTGSDSGAGAGTGAGGASGNLFGFDAKAINKQADSVEKSITNMGIEIKKQLEPILTPLNWLYENVLKPLGKWFVDNIGEILKWGGIIAIIIKIINVFIGVVQWLTRLFAALALVWSVVTAVASVVGGAIAALAAALGLPVAAVVALIAIIGIMVYTIIAYWDEIVAVTKEAFGSFIQSLKDSWKFTGDVWKAIVILIEDAIKKAKEKIYLFALALVISWNIIKDTVANVFANVYSSIKGAFDRAWTTVSDIYNKIKSKFEGLKSVFETIGSAIISVLKKPLNILIDGINAFLSGINKVKIPDWVPGVGGKGFNFAPIPHLAYGGVVNHYSMIAAGEGGYSEAVLPLDRNTEWASKVAQLINEKGPSTNEPLHVTVNLGGETIYDKIIDKINDKTMLANSQLLIN